MPDRRPCRCDGPACNPCRAFRDDPEVRRRWSGEPKPAARAAAAPVVPAVPPPARPAAPPPPPPVAPGPGLALRLPCIHREAVITFCPRGDESLDVYGCGHPDNPAERCTLGGSARAGWVCGTCTHRPREGADGRPA